MRSKFLSLALLAMPCSCALFGQQVVDNICMQVIGSHGLSTSASANQYDATLGECAVASLRSNDGSYALTQGFHQPECAKTPVSVGNLLLSWQINISPNPADYSFQLVYEHPEQREIYTRILSIGGALISDWKQAPIQSQVDCSAWAAGVYFIQLRDPETGQTGAVKFVKHSF